MSRKIDLTGKKFGRLTVIGYAGIHRQPSGHTERMWKCACNCGKTKIISTTRLIKGNVKSCGCLRKDLLVAKHTTHSFSKTPLYGVWASIKDRCYSENCKGYKNYGGRGIRMCKEWKNDFSVFHEWAIENGYETGLTIERIDNNGNYCPENCKWIPKSEQAKNRRNCHYITYHGETKTLSEWCRLLHMDRGSVRNKERQLGDGALAIDAILSSPHHKKVSDDKELKVEVC